MAKKGKFFIFEGLDGSGQSTQAALLRDYLISKGFEVVLTKEPTLDSEAGKKIKEILDEKTKIEPVELQKLFCQDRKEHLEKKVFPALEAGKIVISDRYFFSTFAYGTSDDLSLDELIKMNDDFLLPDLAVILKVSPAVCITRIEKRGIPQTLFEKEQKLAKVWQTYAILPSRIGITLIVDGERQIKEINEEIKKVVTPLLGGKEGKINGK